MVRYEELLGMVVMEEVVEGWKKANRKVTEKRLGLRMALEVGGNGGGGK